MNLWKIINLWVFPATWTQFERDAMTKQYACTESTRIYMDNDITCLAVWQLSLHKVRSHIHKKKVIWMKFGRCSSVTDGFQVFSFSSRKNGKSMKSVSYLPIIWYFMALCNKNGFSEIIHKWHRICRFPNMTLNTEPACWYWQLSMQPFVAVTWLLFTPRTIYAKSWWKLSLFLYN